MAIVFAMSRLCLCQRILKQTVVVSMGRFYHEESLPRITVPHSMVKRLEKYKMKHSALKHQDERYYKGPVVVSCRKKRLNHHRGQTYSNFTPQLLASGGWKKGKSKNDYFTFNPHKGNPAMLHAAEEHATFTDLGLSAPLIEKLQNLNITTPTAIQEKAIPRLLKGANCLCASETGGGKTLAYMLPLLHKILHTRQQRMVVTPPKGNAQDTPQNAPLALVVVPTRQLVQQITSVGQELCTDLNISVHGIAGGVHTKEYLETQKSLSTDVLVCTPGILRKFLATGVYQLSSLQTIVLDEMDTLLDDSFNELVTGILHKITIESDRLSTELQGLEIIGRQLIMVGATIPQGLQRVLGDYVPLDTVEHIETPYVHRVMPHVSQKFIRVGGSEKIDHLLRLLNRKSLPTMIFCDHIKTVSFVNHFLNTNGIASVAMHKNNDPKKVLDVLSEFEDGKYSVLVCTDIASRGLNTTWVQRVINFNFPSFMSDYIHRAGRVGRLGSGHSGTVISYVAHSWEVDLLWKIEASARHVKPLENVNANIKRKLMYRNQPHVLNDMMEPEQEVIENK